MAAGFATALRSTRSTAIVTMVDAGAGVGLLKIYDGTRPATGGTATNLLVTNSFTKPCGVVTSGVLNFSAIAAAVATGTGTATWARISDSVGTFVADVSVGTAATDIILSGTAVITTGNTVTITSGAITEGNA